MLECADFYKKLQANGVDFFTGVPDSLLKDICSYITDNAPGDHHVIPSNEGSAVALASGYYMATKKIPLVYMQNSGLGNAVNPLSSLAAKEVYSLPVLLMIGWRGEPGEKDEPQHMKKGKMTPGLLTEMGIPYEVVPFEGPELDASLKKAFSYMNEHKAPFALLVRKNTFVKYKLQLKRTTPGLDMTREGAIKLAYQALDNQDALFVGNTGMISRELYEHKMNTVGKVEREFFNVGAMGHTNQIALGLAIANPKKQVYCLDGDGSVLMHMGGLTTVGQLRLKNYKHIVLNNGAHDSVGGQPSEGHNVDFGKIALASNYKKVLIAKSENDFKKALEELKLTEGPVLLDVWVNKGARDDLGRPKTTPIENKESFMANF